MSKPGTYPFIACLLLILLSLSMDRPPNVVGSNASDAVFSAERAYKFVQEICRAPHSTGTEENRRVRDYISSQCRAFGLDTEIQHTTAVNRRIYGTPAAGNVHAANVYNIVARLKGTGDSQKCLLVMAHYDTQPNTPGAGDDGAGVAAMLETARILNATGTSLLNDVIFLFTDAEELGMLGAVGFVQDSVRSKEVGLVLNFDNRGNSGVATMFEVNAFNGWAVKHYIQGAEYPIGNSLGYEIYKLLPNDTDYSIFRQADISGLNSGFIEGFVNYHSPNDKAENLDLRSVQQHGGNMLGLIKHFGNVSLENTKAEDVTFFNIAGYWMVSHPTSWNMAFVVVCVLLFAGFIFFALRNGVLTLKGFLIGFFSFIVLLVVFFFATALLIGGLKSVYPAYKNFYGNNAYNAVNYQVALVAMALLLFSLLYRWLLRKIGLHSLFTAILLIEVIVLIALYQVIPTAIFILLFPLMFCIGGSMVFFLNVRDPRIRSVILVLSLLPALWWLPSAISQMFVVFGLTPEVGGVVVITGLLLGMMLPVFHLLFEETKGSIAWLALGVFVSVSIIGHIRSGFTVERPMQTYLSYQFRADEGKTFWATSIIDDWNRQFFPNPQREDRRILNEAPPLLSLKPPTVTVLSDSVSEDARFLHLHVGARPEAISIRVDFGRDNPSSDVLVVGPGGFNGSTTRRLADFLTVHYAGLDSSGFNMRVETKAGRPFEVTLTDRSLGLPLTPEQNYPPHIIPGTGYNANTVQVTRKVVVE